MINISYILYILYLPVFLCLVQLPHRSIDQLCYDALTYARYIKFQNLIHEAELDEESESFSVDELEERFLLRFVFSALPFGFSLVSRSMAWNSELVTVSSMSSSASTSQTRYWRNSWATCTSWCHHAGICEESGELQAIICMSTTLLWR